MTPKDLLSRDGAAAYLGVSDKTLDRIIRDGLLPFYKIRGRVRISTADLDAYVESCRCQMRPLTPTPRQRTRSTAAARPCAYVPGMKVV